MLVVRTLLAVAMIVLGAVVFARMLGFGPHFEILPGIVLGGAMIALGIHRLTLVGRVRRERP
jgi:MFS superfamily sulfate permease-like transporter